MNEYLSHYGIKGQKWGVRRFQNPDGSRTPLGLKHDREIYAQENGEPTQSRSSEKKGLKINKETAKTVAKVAVAAATVAGAAYLYSRNKDAIDGFVSNHSTKLVSELGEKKQSSGSEYLKKCFADTDENHDLYKAAEGYKDSLEKSSFEKDVERAKRSYEKQVEKGRAKAERDKQLKEMFGKLDKEYGLEDGSSYKEYIDSLPSTKLKNISSKASNAANQTKAMVKRASSQTQAAAKRASSTVKNISNNSHIRRSSQPKTKWQQTKDKMKRKAVVTAGTALARKKLDRAVEAKLYGDRRLEEKKEANRHEEEMYRIKRSGKK